MTDETTVAPSGTIPAPTRRGRPPGATSGTPKARTGRPPSGRGDRVVLGAEVVKQIDDMATALQQKFGFKPTAAQTIGWLIASIDTLEAAKAAQAAKP